MTSLRVVGWVERGDGHCLSRRAFGRARPSSRVGIALELLGLAPLYPTYGTTTKLVKPPLRSGRPASTLLMLGGNRHEKESGLGFN